MLLKDHRRQKNDLSLQLCGMVPTEPIMCLSGYNFDKNGENVWDVVLLKETVQPDGSPTRSYTDYIRHIKHTEKSHEILNGSVIVYETGSVEKKVI